MAKAACLLLVATLSLAAANMMGSATNPTLRQRAEAAFAPSSLFPSLRSNPTASASSFCSGKQCIAQAPKAAGRSRFSLRNRKQPSNDFLTRHSTGRGKIAKSPRLGTAKPSRGSRGIPLHSGSPPLVLSRTIRCRIYATSAYPASCALAASVGDESAHWCPSALHTKSNSKKGERGWSRIFRSF